MDVLRKNKYFTESRLNSLYSDFSKLKQLNHDGYEANINAWNSLLKDISTQSSHPVLSATTLTTELTHPIYGKPHVKVPIEELVRRRVLVPLSEFKEPPTLLSYMTPSKWVQWAIHSEDNYIYWDLLVALAEKCIPKGKLFTKLTLKADIDERMTDNEGKVQISEQTFDLVLTYLSRKNKCTVDGNYVKFGGSILDDDKKIANLHALILETSRMALAQENRIADLNADLAKINIKQNSTRARHILKLRRAVQKSYDHVTASHSELVAILLKIDESHFNAQLFNQLAESSAVLKKMNNKIDLDELYDLKEDIREDIAKVDEVLDALGDTVGDHEVEEEFEKLLRETNQKSKESTEKTTSKNQENERNANQSVQDTEFPKAPSSSSLHSGSSSLADKLENMNISKEKVAITE